MAKIRLAAGLSRAIVNRLVEANPQLIIEARDLVAAPLPHIVSGSLPTGHSRGKPAEELNAGEVAEREESDAVLTQFLAADIVVIGVPMYNYTIPSQLKAWIDRIVVSGKTFDFGPGGPRGLAGRKRVILAVSRGGQYGSGSGQADIELSERYMRVILGFIGITKMEVIVADGTRLINPELREKAIAAAHAEVLTLAA